MRTIRFINSNPQGEETITFEPVDGGALTAQIGEARVKITGDYRVSEYAPRVNTQSRFGRSGGVTTGDREVPPREIIMQLWMSAKGDDRAYHDAMETLIGFFRPRNTPAWIYDDQDDVDAEDRVPRRARVELSREDLQPDETGTHGRIMSGDFALAMLEGHWEDADLQSQTEESVGDGQSFNVDNTSKREAYPIYRVTASQQNTLFRITNSTTGLFMEIGSNDLQQDDELVIDSVDGTITINDVEISAGALSEGSSFPILEPGNNTIEYTSAFGTVDITVEWRRRWPR